MKQKKRGKAATIIVLLLAVFMLVCGSIVIGEAISAWTAEDVEAEGAFDPYEESDAKQVLEFQLLSDSFAVFELNDRQEMYFVMDEDMAPYIVCMDSSRVAEEFQDIYDYTFSDEVMEQPVTGRLEGYAIPIEDELKELAIEGFNYFWNEEIINEENFEEYFGVCYLDTTYQPPQEDNPVSTLITGVFFLLLGIFLIVTTVRGNKKAKAASMETEDGGSAEEQSAEIYGSEMQHETVYTGTGDLPVTGNPVAGLLGAIAGAMLGGLLWILFYKMGRIAAVSGYVAVAGAIFGWCKAGKREARGGSMLLCLLLGISAIVFANYISYTWEIMDAINAYSPGRAQFARVFLHMPEFMSEYELWGSFTADLAMGLLFSAIAGIGGLFGGKKKARKKDSE